MGIRRMLFAGSATLTWDLPTSKSTTQWFPSQWTIAGSGMAGRLRSDALTLRAARPNSVAAWQMAFRLVPSCETWQSRRMRDRLTSRPKCRHTIARLAAPQSIASICWTNRMLRIRRFPFVKNPFSSANGASSAAAGPDSAVSAPASTSSSAFASAGRDSIEKSSGTRASVSLLYCATLSSSSLEKSGYRRLRSCTASGFSAKSCVSAAASAEAARGESVIRESSPKKSPSRQKARFFSRTPFEVKIRTRPDRMMYIGPAGSPSRRIICPFGKLTGERFSISSRRAGAERRPKLLNS